MKKNAKNVLGTPLQSCCMDPVTGYFRDGFCRLDNTDRGQHLVCAIVTDAFLAFTRAEGNDLSTPVPEYGFPVLKPGDAWCLCVSRWLAAHEAGVAPPIKPEATHEAVSALVDIEMLKQYFIQ